MDIERLTKIADRLEKAAIPFEAESAKAALKAFASAIEDVRAASSGSWLGYQALVYYGNIEEPPPGAHFSKEWGLDNAFGMGTAGNWSEFPAQVVKDEVWRRAGNPDISQVEKASEEAASTFDDSKAELKSILALVYKEHHNDKFLQETESAITGLKLLREGDLVRNWCPSGQQMSRDARAIHQGFITPHQEQVRATITTLWYPAEQCAKLAKLTKRLASHLSFLQPRPAQTQARHEQADLAGTRIFIGHGQSRTWKDLKDFIQDRLRLPWDEFDRVPTAGDTTVARLSELLDDATFAFLVMTAEDEQPNGTLRARMNVVHEAGLFQGRLGFKRAIILLEEGCEEFSNVHGLTQIRFPKGNIEPAFEKIRRVLEREGLLPQK